MKNRSRVHKKKRYTATIIRPLIAGLYLIAAGTLAGCGPSTVIGAGAIAGNAAMQERGFGKTVDDTTIEATISANMLAYSAELFIDVSAEVYEGRALLTGKVKQTKDRIEAVRIAWNVSGVKEVIMKFRSRIRATCSTPRGIIGSPRNYPRRSPSTTRSKALITRSIR